MPKSIIHLIGIMALVLVLISVSTAQVKFGATLGVAISNLSIDPDEGVSSDSKTGFTLGAVLEYPVNDNLNIRSGASFTQKGAQSSAEESGIKVDGSTNLSYLTVPILAQYKFNTTATTPYVIGGLDIGILMSADVEAKISGTIFGITFDSDTSYSVKADLSSTDIAFNVGAGYMMEMGNARVYGEILYSLGLLDIDSADDALAVKTKGIIVAVGYIF